MPACVPVLALLVQCCSWLHFICTQRCGSNSNSVCSHKLVVVLPPSRFFPWFLRRSRLQYIINMHPLVGVAALSPHVAATVKARMRMHHVHWMMPVHPVGCSNDCWEGFAVQGK
jgi:hypothetical protein